MQTRNHSHDREQRQRQTSITGLSLEDLFEAEGVVLRDDWVDRVRDAVIKFGQHVHDREGSVSFSLLVGEKVREFLPWLYRFYLDGRVQQMVGAAVGEAVKSTQDSFPSECITAKVVAGDSKAGRRNWHYDERPYTCVLFGTDEGGLEFEEGEVSARVGLMVIYDGERERHNVIALQEKDSLSVYVSMQYLPIRLETEDDPVENELLSGGLRDELFFTR